MAPDQNLGTIKLDFSVHHNLYHKIRYFLVSHDVLSKIQILSQSILGTADILENKVF